MDIKSFISLDKDPVMCCDIKLKNDLLYIIPLQHDKSLKGRGYTKTEISPIIVGTEASNADILDAIETAFEMSR